MNYDITNSYCLRDTEFKDDQPHDTVIRIKGILASHNIETKDVWYETSVPYCYVLSVYVKDSTFKVNGKELTKSFAMTSAYGELCDLSCSEACPIHSQCFQKRFIELSSLVNKKMKEISFEDSASYLISLLSH